jgi:hypothetical protein
MLFTDVEPNVGATTATQFQRLSTERASQGVVDSAKALAFVECSGTSRR